MTALHYAVGLALLGTMGTPAAWAATATAAASVTATIPARTSLALALDSSSAGTSATVVKFDKYDDVDMTGGSPSLMYAPYRSLTNKNWHVASIIANGTSLTFSAAVSGTVGGKNLADVLKVFFGGFCNADNSSCPNKYTDYKQLSKLNETLTGAYSGNAPLTYQLDVSGVTSGTFATGNITYTLFADGGGEGKGPPERIDQR